MTREAQKPGRRRRSDSIRNHERLLQAAREVFSAGGPGASLEAVARKAGLGIGTLYRHFPTREALFQAVYRREVDELVELATTFEREPDAAQALRQWLHSGVRMVATKRGMLRALAPATTGSEAFQADTSARLTRAVSNLLSRGVASGRLRDDIAPEEILRAFLGICFTLEQPGWRDTVTRLLDVFVDGLIVRGRPADR